MDDIPTDMLHDRVRDLEIALQLMVDSFIVRELDKAWRWDAEDGEPELIEPYANAAINAWLVLDREAWLERNIRSGPP